MGLDYVDVWHLHGLLWRPTVFGTGQTASCGHKAKRRASFTYCLLLPRHAPEPDALIDTGELTLHNLLDRSMEAIAYAHERGLAWWSGRVGGGR